MQNFQEVLPSWIICKKENTWQIAWVYLKKIMLVYQLKKQINISHLIKRTNGKNYLLILVDTNIVLEKKSSNIAQHKATLL